MIGFLALFSSLCLKSNKLDFLPLSVDVVVTGGLVNINLGLGEELVTSGDGLVTSDTDVSSVDCSVVFSVLASVDFSVLASVDFSVFSSVGDSDASSVTIPGGILGGILGVVGRFSSLRTKPGGLLIFNTSSNLVAPLSLTASIISFDSLLAFLSFLNCSKLTRLGSSKLTLSGSSTSGLASVDFSVVSSVSDPGLLIFTTSRIRVAPSLLTAETEMF